MTSTAELVLDTGETQSIELGLPRANEMRDFEARIVVVGSEVLAIVRDITERKEMEQRIRRLADENAAIASIGRIIGSGLDIQDVYERFAEHVRGLIPFDRIVITVRGADPGVLVAPYVSGIEVPAWVRGARMKLQGSVEDEALRTRSVCVFQPESADEVRERFPEEMSGFEAGVVSTLVAPLISGDQAIGCLGFSSMKHHAYGEAEERLARIVADQIAGAVANGQLYAELKQAEEAVRDSETRLRDLFEEAPVGYHEIDPNGRITGVNRTEEEMLGYATDEMVGRSIFDFIEESDLARREFAGAKARQRKDDLVRERSFVRKDGSLLPVLVKIRILKDDNGEVTGARVTVQDIADRKRAEEALTKQAQDLARSNAELEQFAYVASHDLQEPLRMVKSYTQLLAKRYVGKLDADADEFIGYAADAATRMGVLISDLFTYSRVGRSGKEFEPVNCEQVLDQVLLNLQTGVEESGAQVTRDPMPTTVADGSQLTQLFQNLIGNAIKYRGEAAPEIHVGSRRANGEWSLYVRDNGMGIDPKHAERIFAIFQRLHTRAEYPGTGRPGTMQEDRGEARRPDLAGVGAGKGRDLPGNSPGSGGGLSMNSEAAGGSIKILLVEDNPKEDADTVGFVLWQHLLGAPCFRAGFCSKPLSQIQRSTL